MMAGFGTSMRSSPGTRWIANTISSVVIAAKTAIALSGVILIGERNHEVLIDYGEYRIDTDELHRGLRSAKRTR